MTTIYLDRVTFANVTAQAFAEVGTNGVFDVAIVDGVTYQALTAGVAA